jgi:hypothetical protein
LTRGSGSAYTSATFGSTVPAHAWAHQGGAMRGSLIGGLGACALVLSLSGPLAAQVFTPTFASPRLINDIGLYVSEEPGNLAIEGIWRRGLVGLRLGYVDHADGLASIGAELRDDRRAAW